MQNTNAFLFFVIFGTTWAGCASSGSAGPTLPEGGASMSDGSRSVPDDGPLPPEADASSWSKPNCGSACPEGSYCADHSCGTSGAAASCEGVPEDCDVVPQKVCGCDGKVYDAWCLALAVCYDDRCASRCAPPDGYFACGGVFCKSGSEYCELVQCNGFREARQCKPLPAECSVKPSCSCMPLDGHVCEVSALGDVTLAVTDHPELCASPR